MTSNNSFLVLREGHSHTDATDVFHNSQRETYPSEEVMNALIARIRYHPELYHQIMAATRMRYPDMDGAQVGALFRAFVGDDGRRKRDVMNDLD